MERFGFGIKARDVSTLKYASSSSCKMIPSLLTILGVLASASKIMFNIFKIKKIHSHYQEKKNTIFERDYLIITKLPEIKQL